MRHKKVPSDSFLKNCKNAKDLPIVEVDWNDASSSGPWGSLESYRQKDTVKIQSVGRMTKNTSKIIQLVQSVDGGGGVSDSITIPKSCITKCRLIGK